MKKRRETKKRGSDSKMAACVFNRKMPQTAAHHLRDGKARRCNFQKLFRAPRRNFLLNRALILRSER